jgi:hypothetical protein
MVLRMYRLVFVSSCFLFYILQRWFRNVKAFEKTIKFLHDFLPEKRQSCKPQPKQTYDVSRGQNRYVRLPLLNEDRQFDLMPTPTYGWIFLKGDPKVVSERFNLSAPFDLCDFSERWGGNLQISEEGFVSSFGSFFLGVTILLT